MWSVIDQLLPLKRLKNQISPLDEISVCSIQTLFAPLGILLRDLQHHTTGDLLLVRHKYCCYPFGAAHVAWLLILLLLCVSQFSSVRFHLISDTGETVDGVRWSSLYSSRWGHQVQLCGRERLLASPETLVNVKKFQRSQWHVTLLFKLKSVKAN